MTAPERTSHARRGAWTLFIVCVTMVGLIAGHDVRVGAEPVGDDDHGLVERLERDLLALPVGRALGQPGHAAAREWIRERLLPLDQDVIEHREYWEGRGGGQVISLETVFPAPNAGGGIVFATAHYDSLPGTPGADDNGSGCAVLLELARKLAHSPASSEVRLIWFDGEERGLLGSQRYAASLSADERRRTVGVLNFESVGFSTSEPRTQRMPTGVEAVFDPGEVGDFILIVGNLDSRRLFDRVLAAFKVAGSGALRVEGFGWVPGKGWVLPDIRRSDHSAFWDIEVPALLITDTADFRNPHYHRSSDRLETLDLEFLAAVALGAEQAIRELAGD